MKIQLTEQETAAIRMAFESQKDFIWGSKLDKNGNADPEVAQITNTILLQFGQPEIELDEMARETLMSLLCQEVETSANYNETIPGNITGIIQQDARVVIKTSDYRRTLVAILARICDDDMFDVIARDFYSS